MLDANYLENYPTTISRDLESIICGELLGRGMSRSVYVFRPDPTKVIKVENESGKFQNILEWEIWQDIQYTKHKKSFAECFFLSSCGIFLIQERTEQPLKEDYPKLIPHFFSDTKHENFGIVYRGGKKLFVCHDYGYPIHGKNFKNKMVKSNWR